jgi:protein disulfide-isomerase A6
MPALLSVFALLVLAVAASAGSVTVLTPDNFDSVVGQSKPVLVEFFAPWCGHCKKLAPIYEELAGLYAKESVVIASVDADAHKDLGSKYGVSGFPTLKFFPASSTTPEDYGGGRELSDFIDFLNGKIGSHVRVKTAPTDVLALTDDTFDSIVLDPKKHVFVEFYAPWCGHCKRLAPDWEKLGQTFSGDADVVIAKIDADKYKVHSGKYGVTGFPTLVYFSKTDKSGNRYSGGRSLDELVKHVNEQSGAQRTVGGGYSAEAGLINELTALAKQFMSEESRRNEILASAEEAASKTTEHPNHAFAKFYPITMKQILQKGLNYVDDEIARLTRIIDTKSVKNEKLAEIHKRKNIVSAFKN